MRRSQHPIVQKLDHLLDHAMSMDRENFYQKMTEILVPFYQSDKGFMIAGISSDFPDLLDHERYSEDGIITSNTPISIVFMTISHGDKKFLPVFSSQEDALNVAKANVLLHMTFSDIADRVAADESLTGLVIDPLGSNLILSRQLLHVVQILAKEENIGTEE